MAGLMRRMNEAIEVTDKRHDVFPAQFAWRGASYAVSRVEHAWTVGEAPSEEGRIRRHCFKVHAADGVYELHRELRDDRWLLAGREARQAAAKGD